MEQVKKSVGSVLGRVRDALEAVAQIIGAPVVIVSSLMSRRIVASLALAVVASVYLTNNLPLVELPGDGPGDTVAIDVDTLMLFASAILLLFASNLFMRQLSISATELQRLDLDDWKGFPRRVVSLVYLSTDRRSFVRSAGRRIDGWVGWLILIQMFAIFVGLAGLVYLLDKKSVFEGLILGAAVVTFLRLQYPRLTWPSVLMYFQPEPGKMLKRKGSLGAASGGFLYLIVENVGLSTYERCSFWATFCPNGCAGCESNKSNQLKPIANVDGNKDLYADAGDWAKAFAVHKDDNRVYFGPNHQVLDMQPGHWIVYPVKFGPSLKVGVHHIYARFSSHSAWGNCDQDLTVEVK